MPLPISRSQMDRLGKRLATLPISDDDYALLERVLGSYDEALTIAMETVADAIEERPTSRLKNTQTIIEKLRRERTMGLKAMQDIAGIRVVIEGDLRRQDEIGRHLRRAFEPHGVVRETDRRRRPSHGYRALHVIVTARDLPVEIQVRTRLQDTWAQILERLGDAWGREIRYGGLPDRPNEIVTQDIDRRQLLSLMMTLSEMIARVEEAQIDVADLLSAAVDSDNPADVVDRAGEFKRSLSDAEGRVRTLLEQMSGITWR
jgi:ppGpp synthetase/RelA/SpoT-type nucleotidyltranferase